jgi:hypothetical protein
VKCRKTPQLNTGRRKRIGGIENLLSAEERRCEKFFTFPQHFERGHRRAILPCP